MNVTRRRHITTRNRWITKTGNSIVMTEKGMGVSRGPSRRGKGERNDSFGM